MWMSSFRSWMRRLDAYPKPLEDFTVQTWSGGLITLVSLVLMFSLFLSELLDFVRPEVQESIYVDTSRESESDNRLRINFDVVLPKVACSYITLDAMDVSGAQHIDIDHNVFKRRLDNQGKPIEEPVKEDQLGERTNNTAETKDMKDKDKDKEVEKTAESSSCGSCYGAESVDRPCCSSCDDVRRAYISKTWKFDPKVIAQCRGLSVDEATNTVMPDEGCQIYGYLEVNRVGGSFHFGPGRSYSVNHVHVHDVQPFASTDFDMTHHIRHLSFGKHKVLVNDQESDNVIQTNPLDGQRGEAEHGATMFHYYIKVVPTLYVDQQQRSMHTNQFSVTRHERVVSVLSMESGMPGVFFSYELAPFMIKLGVKEKSLGHFLASLCAIMGGVFTVAGIVDRLVYSTSQIIRQKSQLGKTT